MKTNTKKIPVVLLLVVLCLTAFPISVFAAENVELKIPVSVELSGETPSPEETYTFVLQAVDSALMPEKTTVKVNGAGTAEFPAINYSTPGIFCYMVTQEAGSHERGHYDETVYYVRVTVTRTSSGGLETVAAAHTDAQMISEKCDITFKNTYDAVKKPAKVENLKNQPKTGDDANQGVRWLFMAGSCLGVVLLICRKSRKHS